MKKGTTLLFILLSCITCGVCQELFPLQSCDHCDYTFPYYVEDQISHQIKMGYHRGVEGCYFCDSSFIVIYIIDAQLVETEEQSLMVRITNCSFEGGIIDWDSIDEPMHYIKTILKRTVFYYNDDNIPLISQGLKFVIPLKFVRTVLPDEHSH